MMPTRSLKTVTVDGYGGPYVAGATCFHPSEGWLVTAAVEPDQLARVDCATGEVLILDELTFEPFEFAFSPRGDSLLAVGFEELTFWERDRNDDWVHLATVSHECEFGCDGGPVLSTVDGRFWLFGDGRWSLWSPREESEIDSISLATSERVLRAGFNAQGEPFAVTYDEKPYHHAKYAISPANLASRRIENVIELDEYRLAIVSYDGRLVALLPGHGKAGLEVRALDTGNIVFSLDDTSLYWKACFAADNRHFISMEEVEGANPTQFEFIDVLDGTRRAVNSLAPFPPFFRCSPYHNILAAVANHRSHPVDVTCVWDAATGECLGRTSGHVGVPFFSPCGNWLGTVGSSMWEESAVDPHPGGTIRITRLPQLLR
jgi:hypothetical protein